MSITAAPPASVGGETEPLFALDEVVAKASSENFPVALRVLSTRDRELLLAIYGFARFVDDVGDQYAGDRLAALDRVAAELADALRGHAAHPALIAAAELVQRVGGGAADLADLIAANVVDQRTTKYASFEQLEAYCDLSANPVGRLVLRVFGRHDPDAVALSDRICTALQVIEHLQDVAEDRRAGRIYLPADDLARFGVAESELDQAAASPALRRLIAFQCGRARRLINEGLPLVSMVSGSRRLALAGFAGGGLAQLDAIERQDFDPLVGLAKASKAAVAASAARLAFGGRGRR